LYILMFKFSDSRREAEGSGPNYKKFFQN
jgi:hypothetical protein